MAGDAGGRATRRDDPRRQLYENGTSLSFGRGDAPRIYQ